MVCVRVCVRVCVCVITCQTRMRHVTHMKESYRTCKQVMSHGSTSPRRIAHTCGCVISQYQRVMSHVRIIPNHNTVDVYQSHPSWMTLVMSRTPRWALGQYITQTLRTHKSIWINKSSVNPKSTSHQSSKPCTVLQYPSRKGRVPIISCTPALNITRTTVGTSQMHQLPSITIQLSRCRDNTNESRKTKYIPRRDCHKYSVVAH